MEVREKLVELLMQLDDNLCDDCGREPVGCAVVAIADHLIADGWTKQEWIAVKDRLPTPFVSVLVQMPGEEPFPTVREGFISNDGIWQSAMFRREPGEVTHWQPMPQPPKGRS